MKIIKENNIHAGSKVYTFVYYLRKIELRGWGGRLVEEYKFVGSSTWITEQIRLVNEKFKKEGKRLYSD